MPCVALFCHLLKGQEILRHSTLLFIVFIYLVVVVWFLRKYSQKLNMGPIAACHLWCAAASESYGSS